MSRVRAGRGQAGRAAAHFCARLNGFRDLRPLLCNSNEGPACARGEPSALRFEPPIVHIDQDRAGARSLLIQIIYVLLIFLSSSRRPCRAFCQPGSRLNRKQARRTRSRARSPGQPSSRTGPATNLWALSFDDDRVAVQVVQNDPVLERQLGVDIAGDARSCITTIVIVNDYAARDQTLPDPLCHIFCRQVDVDVDMTEPKLKVLDPTASFLGENTA